MNQIINCTRCMRNARSLAPAFKSVHHRIRGHQGGVSITEIWFIGTWTPVSMYSMASTMLNTHLSFMVWFSEWASLVPVPSPTTIIGQLGLSKTTLFCYFLRKVLKFSTRGQLNKELAALPNTVGIAMRQPVMMRWSILETGKRLNGEKGKGEREVERKRE